mmetsp:Transcript_76621/g.151867  ORF Transcript_76621/g.151867 Transcript_76621/m.151867 type:complete len:1162 (-) Transcript_76621:155-3640(-)
MSSCNPVWSGSLHLTECQFVKNRAGDAGGGLCLHNVANTKLIDSEVMLNSAGSGGGVYDAGCLGLTLSNTTIANNTANQRGGGIHFNPYDDSWVLFEHGSRLSNNHAASGNSFSSNPVGTSGAMAVLPFEAGFFIPFMHSYECKEQPKPLNQVCNYHRFANLNMTNLSWIVDDDVPSPCILGHFCNGLDAPAHCPAGTMGNETRLSSAECGGPCPVHHYCPLGAISPLVCPDGTHGSQPNATSLADCASCPEGHWCNSGQAFACEKGTFARGSQRVSLNACQPCPFNTTTNGTGHNTSASCVCQPGFFDDLGRDAENAIDNRTGTRTCLSCPLGFNCSVAFSTTITSNISPQFWRPHTRSMQSKRCPHVETCLGGESSLNFSLDDKASCKDGFHGAYCSQCIDSASYFDKSRLSCEPCTSAVKFFGLAIGAIAAVALIPVFAAAILSPKPPMPLAHTSRLRRCYHAVVVILSATRHTVDAWASCAWRHTFVARLRTASKRITLPVKVKFLLHFALVIAQIGDVYQVRYPQSYDSVSHRVFAPFRLQLFGWFPGLHMRCLGISTLNDELAFYLVTPITLSLLAVTISWLRYHSLIPALPFILRLAYLLYPSISSKGFQALGDCDCFQQIDGAQLCFLPADYLVQCDHSGRAKAHAPTQLLFVGSLAIAIFGVGVPLLYAGLLCSCRNAIRLKASTPLRDALMFLHGPLHPWALFWPLVEAVHALLLTGFLALVTPGHLFQLLCGLLVAIAFLVLQIWTAPYRTASNNFLAMALGLSIVLHFVSSVGVQVNSLYGGDIAQWILSIVLWASAFAIFLLTFLTFLTALRQSVTPAQLSTYLLNEEPSDGAVDTALPLNARFGELSINATDVHRALHAPLVTLQEVETLRSISRLTPLQTAEDTSSAKYSAAGLVLGELEEAAHGIAHQLQVPYLELHARMGRGVTAIEEEIAAHGTTEDKRCLRYILHEPAGDYESQYEPVRAGKMLNYFVNHPISKKVGLEEAHVVALRLYTSQAFASLNTPLRCTGTHPFPATVAFLVEGIKLLRAVRANESLGLRMWRGIRFVSHNSLAGSGGTERAMLSFTTDLTSATHFATSQEVLLLLIRAKTFSQCGASLDFLSCVPHEHEVCYPPSTYLQPTGRMQQVELPGNLKCTVLEVIPHVSR